MSTYYFTKISTFSFNETIEKVTEYLQEENFGILTDIDVKATLKKKLDTDFRPYRILGACNPEYAYKALLVEKHIGTMLPCNIIVQETEDGKTEVTAVDPVASMQAVNNPELFPVAAEIQRRLKKIIDKI